MAGKPDQLLSQFQRRAQSPVLKVEVQLLRTLFADTVFRPSPELRGQGAGDILGQPHRLADLAYGTARTIADHRRADRGPIAAVSLIDPLDDLFAPLVLEIHVDIRRFPALGGDKTLEEQARAHGVDGGDAEHVAHGAVRSTSAPLAEDALGPRESDDAVHGQEIRRVLEVGDQPQLMPELPFHILR